MAELLRPGGVLIVIGLARGGRLTEAFLIVPAMVGNRVRRAASAWRHRSAGAGPGGGYRSPIIWPPPLSYRQVRGLAARLLPGCRYRRRLYWRYSVTWTKPRETGH
jgi:hypothetical protein